MLDIAAFSNAMRHGRVSFLRPLGLRPFEDRAGAVVSFQDDDAIVFPMARDATRPTHALRLPLNEDGSRLWPSRYADLAMLTGAIRSHLPAEMTMLDVQDVAGTEVALVYDWVPGETLTTRMSRARVRQERDLLAELLWPLAAVAEALRVSGVVHGDIAPGNIIVRPDGGMTLVDLDRMGFRDGSDSVAPRRRPGYRIPHGEGDPVEEDAFGLLVLMTSCAVMADASVPIDREQAPASSHPVMVFSSWDLMDPRRSRRFRELEGELSPLSRELVDLLIQACGGSSNRLPMLLREAVRLARRSVSPPDAGIFEIAETGWSLVDSSLPDATGTSFEPHTFEVFTLPVVDVPGQESTWPDLLQPEVDSVLAREHRLPPEPVGTWEWQPEREKGRSIEDLVDTLREIGERGVDIQRSQRRSSRAELRRQQVAAELREALAQNDRATLVRLAMSGSLAELGESRRSDLVQVVRALAHDAITRAVARDDDDMIVAAIDSSVFERDGDLDPVFRDRVRIARVRVRWIDHLMEAIRTGDAETCASLMEVPPSGAIDRLPEPIRRRARQLVERHDAVRDAHEFLAAHDAEGLVRALGRLVTVCPMWSDHIQPEAVEQLLGIEQIEEHLERRLSSGPIALPDQWMVDLVLAAGRLPDVTHRARLTPQEVRERISHNARRPPQVRHADTTPSP